LLTLLALGAIILWKLPNLVQNASDKLQARPLPSGGWGFVILILGYALSLVIFLTVIFLGVLLAIVTLGGLAGLIFGLGFTGLAFAIALFTILVTYISKLVVACMSGKLIIERIAPAQVENKLLILLVGVLIYVLLRAIPGVSQAVGLLATLFGLGAMWLFYWDKKKGDKGLESRD